ncbi:MAG: HAD family phosphatase, partial [Chloroflexi bacterium]|nr:HAD family phosphatase [Chloroflexota bacterium]
DPRLQLGEISSEVHWQNISQSLGLSAAQAADVRNEFFAGDELDSGLIDYIGELKQKYRLAMLSNAPTDARNSISEKWHIDDAFDLIIISAEVGLMKPDPAIYELTLKQLGFEPYEAVFIDDFSENIKTARQVGMPSILFHNPDQTRADLQSLLDDVGLNLP